MSTDLLQEKSIESNGVLMKTCATTAGSGWQVGAAILGGNFSKGPETSYLEYECINDSFPFKLHIMLSEMEEEGLGHIVSWQPHGKWYAQDFRH
jgi:hypothetical protein